MTADVCPKCKSDIVWERRWFLDGATASHVCDDKWHDQTAPSEPPALTWESLGPTPPPYSNCKYQICDLPGQCVSEGACHHPKNEQQARREAWEAATDKPTLEPDEPKLQKPAKVGGAIFGCGVSERLVIEAAQRNYAYNDEDAKLTPDERQQRERYRRELWDSIHGSPQSSPAAPVSATPRTDAFLENEVNSIDNEYLAFMRQLERELAEAKRETAESDGVIDLLAKRLAEVCVALKGEPPPLVRYSYHDLGDVAAQMKQRAESAEARAAELQKECDHQRENKDSAYFERNVLVSALARIFPSGIRDTQITGWDSEWNGCVYIDLPSGQVSYHYHTSHAWLFEFLPPYTKEWDGHDKDSVHSRLRDDSVSSHSLQAKLDAETARADEALKAAREVSDYSLTLLSQIGKEKDRADGAHNAAIDKVIRHENLWLSGRQREEIAALKVPQ